MAPPPRPARHSLGDDLQAFATSILLVSLGLALLGAAGLVTGGTPGLAFLLHYATGWPVGVCLFAVNVPFYVLAWREFGSRFTARTLAAVTGLSVGVELVGRSLSLHVVDPWFAAVAGGVLIGVGLLVLFRHGGSLGGVNVLALALHRRLGWRVGAVQLAVDGAIVVGAFAVADPVHVARSVLGAVALNAVLLWNHGRGRYIADPMARPG
jgi:uncharacterized membrane-anchored protein YitT (DUF2179 family)